MVRLSKKSKAKIPGGKLKSPPIPLRVILTYDSEENSYTAEIPDLPGCITGGKTRDEALRMAHDAVECYLHGVEDKNQTLQKNVTEEWLYLNWVTAADKPLKLSYLKPAPKLRVSGPKKQRRTTPKK